MKLSEMNLKVGDFVKGNSIWEIVQIKGNIFIGKRVVCCAFKNEIGTVSGLSTRSNWTLVENIEEEKAKWL